MPNFADQLTAARKAAGMTQEQLADAVHVARNTISSWEHGRTQPDLDTLRLLGQTLHYDFMNGETAPQAEAEKPAEAAPAKKLFTRKNIIIAAAALAAVVLIVCLLVVPKLSEKPKVYKGDGGKEYLIADYKAVTPNEAGKAYLSITTTLEKEPTSYGGAYMYSFMMKEENTALRDAFDAQITAMKEDGTLQKLIDEHIIKVAETGEPVAIAFEQFEGNPIKVAVTGSLPPMDYVAADGSFAGFNTAVLAEIGRRLQKNMELVQVDSVGRALALSEGTVDVVFWTRGMSEATVERRQANGKPSEEELETRKSERLANMSDEEKAIIEKYGIPDAVLKDKFETRDLPAGAIITQPYFSNFAVAVTLK